MDTDKIIDISNKIRAKMGKFSLNEEQTKTYFIMPLFMALGYDVFSMDEFIPEYTADFGVKQGEKVDYAICINGQPIVLVECKKLNTTLSSDHISQLFRYYASTDAKIGLLTNGDDYWFFADSIKRNQMDRDPYLRIKLSNLSSKDLEALECYTRDNIDKLNITEDVQSQRFRLHAQEFIENMHSGNLSSDFLEFMCNKFKAANLAKSKAASIYNEVYKRVVLGVSDTDVETVTTRASSQVKEQKLAKWKKDDSKMVNLPIGKPIELRDGSLAFHTPSTIIIQDNVFDIQSIGEILTTVLKYIMTESLKNDKQKIYSFYTSITSAYRRFPLFTDADVFSKKIRGLKAIQGTEYSVSTAFGADDIVRFTLIAAEQVGINESDIKVILSK